MDHMLMLLLLLCSSGLQAEEKHISAEPDDVRLVGGASRCAGRLEVRQYGDWKPVDDRFTDWNLKAAAAVCRELGCGSVVSTGRKEESSKRSVWRIRSSCLQSGYTVDDCVETSSVSSPHSLEITCSESVRLVNGNSLCSGRVEVKSDQSWSSVCEADFDQQDAEVVCRELGCGPPSLLQGALYGEGEAPMWTKEFQCEGNESSLLDCGSSGSARNTCSPGKAVGLTCSEPDVVRVVGGASRCAGILELKQHGEWRRLDDWDKDWNLKAAAAVCRELGCGSALTTARKNDPSHSLVWKIRPSCLQSGTTLRECVETLFLSSLYKLDITCSESVRLVNGNSLCSGRVEVKSDQSWSSVCEADFDQQDAEVLCRELGCGPPSVLQGALYGEAEAPMWTKEFLCEGSESSLLDCGSSGSARNTCSPGKAVGLTCSEPDVRLVGGASHCAGKLELQDNEGWHPVYAWLNLRLAAVVCRKLDCGSVVSAEWRDDSSTRDVLNIRISCFESGSTLKECVETWSSPRRLDITCSESVRLVNGNSLCSGRVEVKSDQSWSSVCEADFDQQDAEVLCRELGCGPPSVLQGALYGEVEAPMWTKEFQCEGSESSLLDCGSSGSARNTCSPGKAVGLTCSEPVRLAGGASRCAGTLEMKQHGQWKPVDDQDTTWKLRSAAAACRELDCGSAVSAQSVRGLSERYVWQMRSSCLQSGSTIRECVVMRPVSSSVRLKNITCSDLLVQPIISLSSSLDKVHEDDSWTEAQQQERKVFRGSNFTISCSIQPQYPGGSFLLAFTSSNTRYDETLPAVNHSAHFLFPAADHAHQGTYSCVYHVFVVSHNFSSESQPLLLTVSDLLVQPNISLSPSMHGVSEALQQELWVFRGSNFTISCSIQSQYPGGSFILTFTSSNTTHNYTLPAVNHSAHFLFPAADHAHQGNYSCVYHVFVVSHNFSSESQTLSLTVADILMNVMTVSQTVSKTAFITSLVVVPLTVVFLTIVYFYFKITGGQMQAKAKESTELDHKRGGSGAEGEPGEEVAALRTE
ncbi:scavenger receptor cysteine-rich type 1 protein M130-like isoform X1 [Myripristis murdjan]|uniref:scavenger receptor cysteine-rich type 1 protein M130-like isoform X1 n=1 Tax=Myripristis murdjan TaxID=586833 RepID=UPI001175CC9C|nr:scavenger receptor cysteine-rich type 1 protein M130-like isoform X1 [Myripristis murdjan]